MLPHALVLSADEKVGSLLQEALAGNCEICLCKEIFAAVEELTRENFDLLVIDWQDELESNFLLKTARGLKRNREAFAVAVVMPVQEREALEIGADAVLVKPFSAQQARNVVLSGIPAECQPAAGESSPEPGTAAHVTSANAGLPKSETNIPCQVDRVCAPQPHAEQSWALPEPAGISNSGRSSRLSRALSLTAILWPVVIAAALLAFDQWPRLSQQGWGGIRGTFAAAQARIRALPDFLGQPRSSISDEQPYPSGMPITGDLLADYATPEQQNRADTGQNTVPQTLENIDFASVEALPPSTRVIAPVLMAENFRKRPEIPNSLRVPLPLPNAIAVSPKGNLQAPSWVLGSSPVTLPEVVSRDLLERQVTPQYPEQALRAGMDGTVVLQASIGRDGAIRDLKLVSGYLLLGHAAFDAVRQWRFKPYRRYGKAVEVETFITVDFKRPPRG